MPTMTSKERVRLALTRQQPDRVPVFVTLKGALAKRLAADLGFPFRPAASSILENRLSHHDMLTSLGNDAVGVGYTYVRPMDDLPDGRFRDEFGFVYHDVPNEYGVNREIIGRPLAGITAARELAGYRFPDPHAPGRFDLARDMIARFGGDHAVIGMVELTVFEYAWNLVGLEQFLVDLASGAPYVEPLLDMVLEFNLEVARILVDLGADVILTGDDFGTQGGLLVSPRLWRLRFKERMRSIFAAIKERNPETIVAYHSCGAIAPLVPDLIEIGLEVLNPVQPNAAGMDPAALKAAYGDRLAFFGGVDTQGVVPFGSADDVREEVRRRIGELGSGGGYLLAPAHDIQPEVPTANVLALFEAARDYGAYVRG